MLLYILVFSSFSILRHLSSCYGDPDLGIYNQSFCTTAFHGKLFYNTYERGSHFRLHNSPIFFLLLPFYYVIPNIVTLMILQTVALALGSIPVYLLAKEKISPGAGYTFSLLYLLCPLLHGVNFDPFHELAFAVTPLLCAIYFYAVKHDFRYCWLFLLLALLCKEDVSFTISFFGLYVILDGIRTAPRGPLIKRLWGRHQLQGLLMIAVGIAYISCSLYLVLPWFNRFLPPSERCNIIQERFGFFGSTLPEILINMVIHPLRTMKCFLVWHKICYIIESLAPLAFLSFLELPLLLVAIPTYSANLLSSFLTMSNSGSRYPSLLIPFIFGSAIIGLSRLLKNYGPEKGQELYRKIMMYPIILTLLFTLFINPSPFRVGWEVPVITRHQRIILSMLRKIPRSASLSTQVNIYQHASYRLECYAWYHEGTEYLLLDPGNIWYNHFEPGWDQVIEKLLDEKKYVLIGEQDGVYLYKKSR